MRPVKILTDSCADLTGELLEKYNIDYAKMCTVYNGVSTPALLTCTPAELHEMYEIMRAGNRILTTQVPVEEFMRIFKQYIDEGYDIVYIACCSKQSGSVNTAGVVASSLMEENPGVTISCIDSLNSCMGEGMLAIEASRMAAAGMSANEITEKILPMRNTVNEYIAVHSLDALRRAGRVKASAAFFGNLMGVKPILISDADGVQTPLKKVKGRQNSIREVVNLLKEAIINAESQTIYITHADCSEEEVNMLVELVKAEIPCKDVYTCYIGPIIGASVGPDTIGVWGFGKEVTYRVG